MSAPDRDLRVNMCVPIASDVRELGDIAERVGERGADRDTDHWHPGLEDHEQDRDPASASASAAEFPGSAQRGGHGERVQAQRRHEGAAV
jgi:hypothetical protein